MKKSKIIASLCTLILTLACLTFGVYSAVKTSFTASGTITFNAYDIRCDVKCTISGTTDNNRTIYGTTFQDGTARENYTSTTGLLDGVVDLSQNGAKFSLGKLEFDELFSEQNLITINFEFTNYSKYQVEAIAETMVYGSALDNLIYQPKIQSLMDKVDSPTQNSCGFSVMFMPKGTKIQGESDNVDITITLKPAEQEYAIQENGFDAEYPYFEGVKFNRLNYNNLAYAIKSPTTASVGFDETTTEAELPNTYPIPTKIFGYTVDELYTSAFNSEEKIGGFLADSPLQYMMIPESVKIIGDSSFCCVGYMHTVCLSSGLQKIDGYAFSDCSLLNNIAIPSTVTSMGDYAFYNCSNLTSITIPDNVTSIGTSAFRGCSSLTTIVVESGNAVYDSRDNCNAIIETGTNKLIAGCKNTIIPETVTIIGERAFYDCSGLTTITIPDSVTSIGNYAFSECYALAEVYNLSPSLTITAGSTDNGGVAKYVQDSDAVYKSASTPSRIKTTNGIKYYENNDKIVALTASDKTVTTLAIKAGCTAINQYAFYYCSSLTTITIPDSVTSIERFAFSVCSSLTTITIPEGVTSIGDNAFMYCTSLTTIDFKGTKEQWNAITKGSNWNDSTGNYTIKCTDGDIAKA